MKPSLVSDLVLKLLRCYQNSHILTVLGQPASVRRICLHSVTTFYFIPRNILEVSNLVRLLQEKGS